MEADCVGRRIEEPFTSMLLAKVNNAVWVGRWRYRNGLSVAADTIEREALRRVAPPQPPKGKKVRTASLCF